ncbi:MAG: sn-glycerol-1-phosphate dehydrogenase [Clostridia bacterium]|nr:sn-glycerol-1-phosphate dehydrogenase [Clostridia bacterium]
MSDFILRKEFPCACGRVHKCAVNDLVTGSGAISRLPALVKQYGSSRPFLLADADTWQAAGMTAARLLTDSGIPFSSYVFPAGHVKPDETTAGAALMHFDPACDVVISIGSGVLNDTGKLLASRTGLPYFIVATASSMDGFASATSSMECGGVKVSLNTKCPEVIIGDTDVLKGAPARMLSAGIGDMIAKYVSICEWRISHVITGEYYCPVVADMVRQALRKCVRNADGLMKREPEAVEAVFEGLVLGGAAMSYAGLSRPASGVEHYFSHIWDMRALEFGTPSDYHGIQCATATRVAVSLYAQLRRIRPDREKALAYAASFARAAHDAELRRLLGRSAEPLIGLEDKEKKYDPARHASRLEVILARWDEITAVMDEELPALDELDALLDRLCIPRDPAALGLGDDLNAVFRATGDIRDKYVLSRLCRDLGVLEEMEIG